jgi:hypothetical protein
LQLPATAGANVPPAHTLAWVTVTSSSGSNPATQTRVCQSTQRGKPPTCHFEISIPRLIHRALLDVYQCTGAAMCPPECAHQSGCCSQGGSHPHQGGQGPLQLVLGVYQSRNTRHQQEVQGVACSSPRRAGMPHACAFCRYLAETLGVPVVLHTNIVPAVSISLRQPELHLGDLHVR